MQTAIAIKTLRRLSSEKKDMPPGPLSDAPIIQVDIEPGNYANRGKVISSWTEYMDESGSDNYAAWKLTPFFTAPNRLSILSGWVPTQTVTPWVGCGCRQLAQQWR
jgi:hypothetical protein